MGASSRRYIRGRPIVAEQQGAVEFLDIDPAVLNWFEGLSVIEESTGGLSGFGNGRSAISFIVSNALVNGTGRQPPHASSARCSQRDR